MTPNHVSAPACILATLHQHVRSSRIVPSSPRYKPKALIAWSPRSLTTAVATKGETASVNFCNTTETNRPYGLDDQNAIVESEPACLRGTLHQSQSHPQKSNSKGLGGLLFSKAFSHLIIISRLLKALQMHHHRMSLPSKPNLPSIFTRYSTKLLR